MNITPIEIHIDDKRDLGLIAFLVDRPDFLADIHTARSKLKISELPYKFNQYPFKLANYETGVYSKGLITLYQTILWLEGFCAAQGITLAKLDKTLASAMEITKDLQNKYGRSSLYFPVILSSILIGAINEDDFVSTYVFIIDPKKRLSTKERLVTIVVNRESTLNEVQKNFNFIQEYYQGGINIVDNKNPTEHYKHANLTMLPDTISNIIRDREWYWKHENGLSYQQIWEQTDKKHRPSNRDGIIKAIKQYQKRLGAEAQYYPKSPQILTI